MRSTKWTLFCSLPGTPRGQYDEEIEVVAPTAGQARKKGEQILSEYDTNLKIKRIVRAGEWSVSSI